MANTDVKIKKFEHMIGQVYKDKDGKEIYVTRDLLITALRRIIAQKRRRKNFPNIKAQTVIEKYITEEEIINILPSVFKFYKVTQTNKHISDIRESEFGLDELEELRVTEQEFVDKRKQEYLKGRENNLEPSDDFMILQIILLELEILKLNKLIILDPEDKNDLFKKLKPMLETHKSLQDGLGFLRKQRKSKGQEEEINSIYGLLGSNMSEEDLEGELSSEEEEEKRFLEKRKDW